MSIIFIRCLYPHSACSGRAAQSSACALAALHGGDKSHASHRPLSPEGSCSCAGTIRTPLLVSAGTGQGQPQPSSHYKWGQVGGEGCAGDAVGWLKSLSPPPGSPQDVAPWLWGGALPGAGGCWDPPGIPLPGAPSVVEPREPHLKLIQRLSEVTPGGDAHPDCPCGTFPAAVRAVVGARWAACAAGAGQPPWWLLRLVTPCGDCTPSLFQLRPPITGPERWGWMRPPISQPRPGGAAAGHGVCGPSGGSPRWVPMVGAELLRPP